MNSPLFTRYRPPAQNSQGIPIVGDDEPDIGSDVAYGQNNDDSGDDDLSTGLYGAPSAQSPPSPPSPSAQLTGGSPSVAANAPPPPPAQLADSAPPSPIAPPRSPYAAAPTVSQDVQKAISDRAQMQRPALPKLSIWRQLAATLGETALGAITGGRKQGQEMAQELGQDIRYGPTAVRDQGLYNQKVADADSQLAAIGKGEDILSSASTRDLNADTKRTNAITRQAQLESINSARTAADLDSRLKQQDALVKSGGRQVPYDAAPTPGTIRVPDPMDLDPKTGQFRNKTALDVPEHKGEVQITPETAPVFKLPAGTWIPTKDYADILGKNIEFTNKPPNEAAQKDTQIKADLAGALGVDPASINDAQMNAARRMFGGEQVTAAHLRDFITQNKRLPNTQEEAAIVDKDFKSAHPNTAAEGTWTLQEDSTGKPVLFNARTGETKAPPEGLQRAGTHAKADAAVAPVQAAVNYANDYLKGGQFTGPSDEALQEKFFELAKPSSGFRMTQPQMDMLMHSRGWLDSAEGMAYHAKTGQWFPPEQRKQIVDTINNLAASKGIRYVPQAGAQQPSTGGKIVVTAPDGSQHPFDTQAQADQFKKLAGIK